MGTTGRPVRHTYQRHVIMEELCKVGTHLSAYDVYKTVKARIPQISFGTVYRNLNLLKEQGVITELAIGRQASLWDGNSAPHYHFVCEACTEVKDVFGTPDNNLESWASEQTGLNITGYKLEFYGLCPKCSERQAPKLAS